MKTKEENPRIEMLWVKLITRLISLITLLIMAIVLPKTVFNAQTPFRIANSMAVVDENSLLFYDYQVYATEARFNQGLVEDFEEVINSFKSRSEIVAIQVNGDQYSLEYRDDYIFITNPEVPDLNLEYYLVRNLEFDGISLPIRTFIILFNDIASLVNTIYIVTFIIVSLSIFSRLVVKSTTTILEIKKYQST